MDDHEMRSECRVIIENLTDRMDKAEQCNKDNTDRLGKNDVDIGVLKNDMQNLIKSMDALSKSIWGLVLAVAGTGIGFIIWYIQKGG